MNHDDARRARGKPSPEVAVRRVSQLGEGSLWDAGLERLLWVDIMQHRVMLYDPATGTNLELDVGGEVGTVVVARNGKLVAALADRLAVVDVDSGQVSDLVRLGPRREGHRCNDGKCDPRGRLWVGTMGPAGAAALYCVDSDLTVSRRLDGVTVSNGLAWNRAATRFYYVDTPTHRVDEFDYDVETGQIAHRRTVVEIPPDQGAPDGMTIDDEDRLWVALWGGSSVIRLDPASGRVLERIELPVCNVTSCAFGGPELDRLYVTTARAGTDAAVLDARPESGSLFRVQVSARGVLGHRFARDC
jgi:sugar lactone lactonase YvrE